MTSWHIKNPFAQSCNKPVRGEEIGTTSMQPCMAHIHYTKRPILRASGICNTLTPFTPCTLPPNGEPIYNQLHAGLVIPRTCYFVLFSNELIKLGTHSSQLYCNQYKLKRRWGISEQLKSTAWIALECTLICSFVEQSGSYTNES